VNSLTDIVPYSFTLTSIPEPRQGEELPAQAQGVYITLSADYHFILNKMIGWFSDRDEVELIDHGYSDKAGLGYIILEWTERTIDPLFLAILRDEEIVADYAVYTRDL
jgi:hypothetical protein